MGEAAAAVSRNSGGACKLSQITAGTFIDEPGTYVPPAIEDYGSLVELTAAFDPDLLNTVAKSALSLAVVSTPIPPGNVPDSGVLPETLTSTPTGTETVGQTGPGGGSGSGAPGGTVGQGAAGVGSGGGGSGSAGAGGSAAGGRLPFTGYTVVLTAAVGAAIAGAGTSARSALRRRHG